MVEFCPECGSLLRKTMNNGKTYLVCKCGFKKPITIDKEKKKKQIEKKKKALEKNLIIVNPEDKITVNLIINKTCPKCKYPKAETWQEQTRSADEPSTTFFRCLKCKHTWREY